MRALPRSSILFSALCALASLPACSSAEDSPVPEPEAVVPLTAKLDLADVKTNPDSYEWFDFRPNVLKLILAGAAETEHIAILWYTVTDGAVGLHYHSMTESVYVIEGTQTDGKGSYPTGSVYFNPPGSGHQISDSSGFFLLAYASPPDFMATDMIGEYEPVRIDTTASDLTTAYPFEEQDGGATSYTVPLDESGGLKAAVIELSETDVYTYTGNYVLVLSGSCEIGGERYGAEMLSVTKAVGTTRFELAATAGESCLAMAVSF
jgi:hypothetical protein